MSHQKLTIVVTCTDRKALRPKPRLLVRNLPAGSVQFRLDDWLLRIRSSPEEIPLLDLYRGETWSQVRLLIDTAGAAGFEPEVFVASAGLGLRSARSSAGAYSATFAAASQDSVASSLPEAREWWRGLPHQELPSGQPCLMVLPQTYARVIAPMCDWDDLGPTVVFGGSAEVPSHIRIPADRRLRRELGGTATSINVRMATQWLKLASTSGFATVETSRVWEAWQEPRRQAEVFNRTPMTNREVRSFVTELLAQQTGVSKSRALRILRDSGMACEQRRFSELFDEVAP